MAETPAPAPTKNTLTLRGLVGALKVGYQTAATLGRYELTTLEPGYYAFEAAVVEQDDFWLSQGPLTLQVEVGPSRWSWRVESVELGAGKVRCTVHGSPERR